MDTTITTEFPIDIEEIELEYENNSGRKTAHTVKKSVLLQE